MPEQDEPMWPAADEDSAGAATHEQPGDGKTDQLAVPTVTNPVMPSEEQPISWFRPARRESSTPPPAPRPELWQSERRQPAQFQPPRPEPPHKPAQAPVGQPAVPMRIEPTGELHVAEATTRADNPVLEQHTEYVDVPKPDSEAPPKTRHKRRRLLIGTLALVLVVLLGGATALPRVSNRLELPWAPNKPKGDAPGPVAVTRVLHGPDGSAASPTATGVDQALSRLAGNAALGKLTGSVLDPAAGEVLWDRGSGQPLTPASTAKLLTVAAALLALDHGLQLSTKVVEGTQPGTVVLVGGGDPTLNSLPRDKNSLYPGAAHFDDLIAQVKKATGGEVKKVQLDVGAYTGPVTAPGWEPGDAPSTFAAPVVPVMLDGGRTEPNNDHAMRVANPATTAVQRLAQGLGAQAQGLVTAPPGAKVLGEVKSAPMTELVNTLLQSSDDTLAEAVARQTALAAHAEPSFDGAAKATMDVLSRNGFDLTGVALADGSGLSALDKIPAKVLSQVLAVAAGPDGKDPRTAKLRPMLGGLPVAGGSGTLATRYADATSATGRGWLRAKTGSLRGVNTLAGLVLDTDGRVLVFALMSSGGADQDLARAALDAIAATLRGCGCR